MQYNVLSGKEQGQFLSVRMYCLSIPLIFPHTVKEQQSEYKIVFTDFLPRNSFILAVWTDSTTLNTKF